MSVIIKTQHLKCSLKRREAIEPVIGHLKSDGLLGRNYLKGVRFTKKTITTHKIDPDVDETREYLLKNLAYSQALAKVDYQGDVGSASMDQPRRNLTGDPCFTDGYRLVLRASSLPVDIEDIEVEVWRIPPDRQSTP